MKASITRIMLWSLVVAVAFFGERYEQRQRDEREAIKIGVAEYALNTHTGAVEFHWLTQQRPSAPAATATPRASMTPDPAIIGQQ